MNTVKFYFIVPFVFLTSTESLPVAQPPIRPSHVLHIRKDFPGIISFGPIFISSVKRGIFTDLVSLHSCNGYPYGSSDNSLDLPLADSKEKPFTPKIVGAKEPLEVISVEEDKTEEDGKIDDLVSDYNDFLSNQQSILNKSTLTSEQIYLIQVLELNRVREEQLNQEFQVLNQVKNVPDELEVEKEIEILVEKPSYAQSNHYENIEHIGFQPNVAQDPEFEAGSQENPFETQEYENNLPAPEFEAEKFDENSFEAQNFENDSTAFQKLTSEPDEHMKPVHGTIKPEEHVSEPLETTLGGIQEEDQESKIAEENSTEGNIWSGPTSPEVAQSVKEYVENHKPGVIYPCPPKDSTQISERHDSLIKSSLTGVTKRINNYLNGVRAYAARHDDTTDFV